MDKTEALGLVCAKFDKVKATLSRLEKEALLKDLKEDPTTDEVAKSLFSIGLSWDRQYGLRYLPPPDDEPTEEPSWSGFLNRVSYLEKNGTAGYSRQELANYLAGFPNGTGKWLRQFLLKDLSLGVSWNTCNKIWPGLIKTFDCMLADTCTDITRLEYPLVVESKMDGIRACARVSRLTGKVMFLSRGNNELFHTEEIGQELKELCKDLSTDLVFDGELFAGSFQQTMAVVRRSVNTPDPELYAGLAYYVFDVLTISEWEHKNCQETFDYRRRSIEQLFGVGDFFDGYKPKKVFLMPSKVVTNQQELEKAVSVHLDAGYEGSMLKKPKGRYSFGRSTDWLKLKPINTGDFEVVDKYEGEGKLKGMLGGLVIKLPNGKKNYVGGGFDEKTRKQLWKAEDIIGRVVEVEYKWETVDGRLREPVFVRLREDKVTST
jgi:DNA ligase 1